MPSSTVLTVGSFDILHGDHIHLLEECRNLAGKKGKVVVGLNSDAFIERMKGRLPTQEYFDRHSVLSSLGVVDEVYFNNSSSLHSMIGEIFPNYLVVGSDWAYPKDYMTQIGMTYADLNAYGCNLVFVSSKERIHSSQYRSNLT